MKKTNTETTFYQRLSAHCVIGAMISLTVAAFWCGVIPGCVTLGIFLWLFGWAASETDKEEKEKEKEKETKEEKKP